MREARMARQMGIQRGERHPAVSIHAGTTIVPCAQRAETLPVTLAPFKDHSRLAFVASTIRSRSALQDAASSLSLEDSQRLNVAMGRVMEGFLDTGILKSDAVFKSTQDGKPDIHVIILGNPYQDSSLRLYFHKGEHNGVPVLFQDARTTKKSAERVERAFRQEAGYQPPRDWDIKRRN
ncbi:MAG: hypothetical protein M1405_03195 [Patescibacteria group bacterium]|nr:hypothetical protein [Patescibacteria group bacterium]